MTLIASLPSLIVNNVWPGLSVFILEVVNPCLQEWQESKCPISSRSKQPCPPFPLSIFVGHQFVHVGVRSVVCAWTSNQCKPWTAWCSVLGGSHLSADAWSTQQSESSAAGPICFTTGRAVGGRPSIHTHTYSLFLLSTSSFCNTVCHSSPSSFYTFCPLQRFCPSSIFRQFLFSLTFCFNIEFLLRNLS